MKGALLAVVVILAWVAVGADALAHSRHRGEGYQRALQARAEETREAVAQPPVTRSQAERAAIAKWGSAVGRWWDECARYWPASQLPQCMRVIYKESRGDPKAHNGVYHGLFQQCQINVSVNLFKWQNAIRRAFVLWTSRGWQPWYC